MNYEDDSVKKLLAENHRLLLENNQLLKKLRRGSIVSSVFRVVWFFILLAIPFYLYFAYIQPNWQNLMGKVDRLEQVTLEMSSVKQWFDGIKPSINKSESIQATMIAE